MLHPAADGRLDARILHVLLHFVHDLLDKRLPGVLAQGHLLHQIVINLRLQILQGKVIQLDLDLGNTQAVRNGSVNLHGLPGLLLLLLRFPILAGAHIVEAVRKLDDDHPDIFGHGKKHLAQIIRLNLHLVLVPGQLGQLCNAVHQKRHLCAELFGQLVERHRSVLHHVVKQPGLDGFLVHLQIRQDDRYAQRMDDVGLPRLALLLPVRLLGDAVRLLDHRNVIRRMIFANRRDQILVELLGAGKVRRRFQFNIQFFFCHLIRHVWSPFLRIVNVHYNFFCLKMQGGTGKSEIERHLLLYLV